MGVFKLFQGATYVKKLRVGLNNIKLFLAEKLLYQIPISGATVTCGAATYNGSTQTASSISVVLSGDTLTNNTDYTVTSNSGGVNAGSYTVTVSGINYFNSSANGTFKINPKTVSSPTITLDPSSYTYNGSARKPTPIVKDGSTTIPSSEYTVSYSNNTNAGTATCTITDKSGGNYTVSGSKTFTISKVTPTVTAPVANTLTYNGSAQALATLGSTNFGTLVYCSTSGGTYTTAMISGTNATSYEVWYKVSGDSNVNSTTATKISVTIAKANPTYTAPTAKSLTYNGNAQALLNAGSTSHGTIQYSSDNSTWSTTIPTGTNANTYTSYWRLVGDSNHKDVASSSISTTIAKANGSVTTAPTAKSLTYNGSAQALVNAGSGTGTMLYKLDSGSWGTSIPTATNATSYTVYYKASASTNYNESASGSVACSIAKVTPTVTAPTAKSLTYNGSAQALVNAGSTNWGTLKYSLDNSTYSTDVPNGTNATSYTVYYKVIGNTNINDVAAKTVSVTIGKANPTYTAPTKKNSTYNGNAQNLLNAGSTSHGTFKYSSDNSTWSTTIPQATTAGTYTAYWKLDGDSNHNSVGSTTISSITISKVTPTVTAPTAKVLTFNNANQVLANAGSTNFGTIQYCLNNSGGTYSTTVPSASAANVTYKVWYKVVGNSNVNDVAPASIDCSIAEKRVTTPTITLNPTSYTYSGSQCKPTPTVKDGSTVIPSSEYTVSYSNNTNVGTATVTISDNTAGNYYISGTTTFAISKVTPTVTAPTAKSLTYNGSGQTLANVGSTNFGTLQYCLTSGGTYSTTVPQGTNAGSYAVWYKVVGNSNVNDVAPAKIDCSIAKANGTATVNGTTNTYNGSAKNLITVSNNTGTMHYKVDSGAWSTTVPQATNAGSWKIYWYMDASSNYNGIASASTRYVSSSIAKANGSVTTAPTAKSLTYNGSAQALVNAGTGTGTMLYTAGYDVTLYTEPDGTKWKRIAHHNNPASTGVFSTSDSFSAGAYRSADVWFDVNTMVNGLTSFEFMVKQKTTSSASEVKYRWIQTKSPVSATYTDVAPSNVTRITTDGYTDGGYGGLYILNSSSYMVIANSNNGNWYGAFGACKVYSGGIPGYPNTTVTSGYMDLYVKVSDTSWSTTIPSRTAVGNYVIAYKASASTNYNESASGSVTTTIGKVTPTVTAPKACSLTYNGSAQNLVSGGSTNFGSLQYSTTSGGTYSTTIPQGTNATSYEVWYKVVGNNNVNGTTATKVAVTIAKANPTYTAPTKKTGLVYNGNNQNLLNAGSTSHGTIQYSSDNSTWSTTIPQGKNANTYTAYWKLVGDSNHNNVNSTTISSISIAKVTPTVTAPTAKSLTYNGSNQALYNVGSTNWGTIQYCATSGGSYTTSMIVGKNVGNYDCWYKVVGDSNINDVATAKATGTSIAKKTGCAISFATTSISKTYGNAAFTNAITNSGDGTITWGTSNSTIATVDGGGQVTIKAAGSCTISATTTNTSNCTYSTTAASYTLTVAKAAMTSCTPSAKSGLVYNGSAQVIVSDCTPTGGDVQYSSGSNSSYSTTVPSATNANTYTVNYKNVPDSNHSGGTTGTITTTIAKRQVTCTAPTAKSLTWNGSAQTLANAGSVTSGTMTYCSTSGGTYSATIPTGTAATGYTVWYKSTPDSNHSGSCSGSVSCSIAKKTGCAISFATTSVSKTYGNAAFTNSITNSGDGSISWGSSNTNIATVNSSGQVTIKAAGSCTISATTTNTTNCTYSTTAASYTLTVAKAAMTVCTPTAKSVTYNGAAQQVITTCTPTGGSIYYATSSAGASSSTTVPTQTSVGTWTYYYKCIPDSNHSGGSSSWTAISNCKVTQKALTITAKAQTVTWGTAITQGTSQTTTSGLVDGDSLTAITLTQSTTAVTTTGAITPSAGATTKGIGNYSVTYSNGTLTINKKTGCAISFGTTSVTKTYGNGAFTNAITNTGDGSITWGSSNTNIATVASNGQVTIKAAGSCTISATTTNTSNCTYSTTAASYTLTVAKAAMTSCTPTAKSGLNYNGSAQVLVTDCTPTGGDIQYSGASNSSYSTTVPTATNAGSYTINWKNVPDSNHSGGTTGSVTVAIAKVAMSYTAPSAATRTYNGGPQRIVSGQSANGGSIYYATSSAGTSSSTTVPTRTNTGSTDTWWKAVPDGNHSGGTSSWAKLTGTINKAALTITAKAQTVNYGTAITTGTGQVTTSGLVNGDSLTSITLTPSTTNVPGGTITPSAGATTKGISNYRVTYNTGTLTINKVAMTYTAPKAAIRTYNGSAQQIVSGQSAGGGSIQYCSTSGGTYTTTVPTQTNTGTSYSTWWKAVPDSNHSGGTSAAQITGCTINKASLTITAKAQTVNYGTAITQGTGQVTTSGLVGGDSLTAITLTQSTTNVPGGTITPSAGATTKGISNYRVTYNTGTLLINKVAMTYTAPKAATRTYNGSAQQIVSGGSATGGNIYYATSSGGASSSTTVPTQTNAGIYNTWWKAVPDGNHSGGTSSWANITASIAKASRSVTTSVGVNSVLPTRKVYISSTVSAGDGTLTYYTTNEYTEVSNNSLFGNCVGKTNIIAMVPETTNYKMAYDYIEDFEVVDYENSYLFIQATTNSQFTITRGGTGTYQYLMHNTNLWVSVSAITYTIAISAGESFYLKGNITPSSTPDNSLGNSIKIKCTSGSFFVEGNPMSLLYGDNFRGVKTLNGKTSAFCNLFNGNGSHLTSVEHLSLPATTLETYCYYKMFYGCTAITKAPILPAAYLPTGAYYQMFYGCSNLSYINALATGQTTNQPSPTYQWVNGVKTSGRFVYDKDSSWYITNAPSQGWLYTPQSKTYLSMNVDDFPWSHDYALSDMINNGDNLECQGYVLTGRVTIDNRLLYKWECTCSGVEMPYVLTDTDNFELLRLQSVEQNISNKFISFVGFIVGDNDNDTYSPSEPKQLVKCDEDNEMIYVDNLWLEYSLVDWMIDEVDSPTNVYIHSGDTYTLVVGRTYYLWYNEDNDSDSDYVKYLVTTTNDYNELYGESLLDNYPYNPDCIVGILNSDEEINYGGNNGNLILKVNKLNK